MIYVMICEDDPVSRKVNLAYVDGFSEKYKLEVQVTLFNGTCDALVNKWFDIAILDIDLGVENGIRVAKSILKVNKAAVIIFITNHAEFALDACKLQAYYLLKPVNQIELEQVFAKAVIQVKSIKNRSFEEQITFCADRKQHSLNQSEIIYIERVQRKIKIVTMQKTYFINDSISSIVEKMTNYFIQISQGIIINAREVELLDGSIFYMKTGQTFKMGRRFRNVATNTYHSMLDDRR